MATLDDLTRPIIGIENRTAQEAFDIMADRIRGAFAYIPIHDHWLYAQTDDTERPAAVGIEQHFLVGRPVEGDEVTAEREGCARIAENFTRAGRDWVPDSLWDNITKGIAAAIRGEGGDAE